MQPHDLYILAVYQTQLSTLSTSISIARNAQWWCNNTPMHTTNLVNTYVQVSVRANNKAIQLGKIAKKNCSLSRPSHYAAMRASSSDCLVVYSPTSLVVYPKTIWTFWSLVGVAKNVTKGEFQSWQCEFFKPRKASLDWTALILSVCEEKTIRKTRSNSFIMSYCAPANRIINIQEKQLTHNQCKWTRNRPQNGRRAISTSR